MRRRQPRALLIDFDGVVRTYDDKFNAKLETAAGLVPGTIAEIGLVPTRLVPALLGQVSRAGWRTSVAAVLADNGMELAKAEALMEAWDAYRGAIVPGARALVAQLRAAGVPVALCTNATDDLRDDLVKFGLAHAFDAVLTSAELGVAKPSPDFFAAACAAVSTPPADCLFTDDSARNVAGARAAGLLAYRAGGAGGASDADLRYLANAFANRP